MESSEHMHFFLKSENQTKKIIEKCEDKRARLQQQQEAMKMNRWGHSTSQIRCPPLEPIIWAMYAENGAANVISASHFLSSLSGQAPGAWVGSGC
jgi:hypothetical protein